MLQSFSHQVKVDGFRMDEAEVTNAQLPENSEAMILIAMINLMSRRLAHGYVTQPF